MSYRVYQYTFPDGMIYIGVTKNTVEQRRNQGYQHNKRLQNAMREVGWSNIQVDILADDLTQNEAFEKEKYFIELLDTTNPAIGYNLSKGGKSTYAGLKHTDEYRQKMSKLYKGKVFSDETLKRMKEAHRKERKAVACFTVDGEQVGSYESLHEAAKACNGYPTNISRACKQAGKIYKGYMWFFI
jgi:predicted GIY-YIG superfamily endonuclease